MTYERVQLATEVKPNVLYQIDGRIDIIMLSEDGYTRHHNPQGRQLTAKGGMSSALATAAADGKLWECREVP